MKKIYLILICSLFSKNLLADPVLFAYVESNTNTGGSAVITMSILAAISIPLYQDYIIKSQISRSIGELSTARTYIESNLSECKELDSQVANQSIQVSNLISDYNIEITTHNDNCDETEVKVSGVLGKKAHNNIKNVELTLIRNTEGEWSCIIDPDNSKTKQRKKLYPSFCKFKDDSVNKP